MIAAKFKDEYSMLIWMFICMKILNESPQPSMWLYHMTLRLVIQSGHTEQEKKGL